MNKTKFDLLKKLCSIHAPSGNESGMTDFLLSYIRKHSKNWTVKPEVFYGNEFQNCIVLVFGKPTTAVFAHIDSIGFTARYGNNLIKIGGPRTESGYKLVGKDLNGKVECVLESDHESGILRTNYKRAIVPGTDLTFKCDFRQSEKFIQSCYLDNRLGVWVALQLAETLKNGALVFSCWEEHGGGSAGYLAGFLYEKYKVRQSLICDITWVTEGVHAGKGVAVSMRDSGVPRRIYVERIMKILTDSKVKFQVEVEGSGGSDGNEIQKSPFPIDWCFIGAPEDFVHSPDEKVHISDIESMVSAYQILLQKL